MCCGCEKRSCSALFSFVFSGTELTLVDGGGGGGTAAQVVALLKCGVVKKKSAAQSKWSKLTDLIKSSPARTEGGASDPD